MAEAVAETEHASRHLVQLCGHFDHEAGRHPDLQARVQWTDDGGVVDFGWGHCTRGADAGFLALRAEANDEQLLPRVEHLVGAHLERVATSDQPTVTWTRAFGAGEQVANQVPGATDENAPWLLSPPGPLPTPTPVTKTVTTRSDRGDVHG